jgi:ornithine--oxo-acid transaminase
MIENSLKMGDLLLNGLKELKSPLIKDVRGKGLFCAIELKKDIPVDANVYAKILMNRGILSKATHDTTLRFSPPLVINEE